MQKTGRALGALAVVSLALSGCGVKPVEFVRAPQDGPDRLLCTEIITQSARIPLPTESASPASPSEARRGWETDYAGEAVGQAIEGMLTAPLPATALSPGVQPVSQSVLILSGGSQQGAFGAGFLDAWAGARGGQLPRFRLVTGISTGALQSTFAFLDKTDEPVRQYSIAGEGDLLKPLVKGKLDEKPFSAGRRLATKGTLASLQPLRDRLNTLITHDIMMEVADEARAGRKLLVGAVEMGSGEMAVFDLTKAATLYAESHKAGGTAGPSKAYMRNCYIEALMASSSVPMAAAPVFIDNKMYIDGGARFGVLVDLTAGAYHSALAKAAKERREAKLPDDATPRNLFILVNATLEVPQLCRLSSCRLDENGKPIPLPDTTPHSEWDFLQLAQRSVSVLINQSYRGSVFIADGQYRANGFKTRFARIESDHLTHRAAIKFPGAGDASRTCWQWRQEDERVDKPMEFFPRYMRCLIDYGQKHPEVSRFSAVEPPFSQQ